ncbi:MAG: ECF transporter S component [Clostridia bacterium]|nr:ECF transporter S component [Clostridia bacterium]
MSRQSTHTRALVGTAMLGAIGFVLMFLDFSVPVMPSFIKMDFSELPALLASFAYGPVSGAAVCLIKNVLHLLVGHTGGVGELSNFLLGCLYVIPAGLIYRRIRSRKGALAGSLAGCVISAAGCLPINYYLIYPLYTKLLPIEAILGMYQKLDPSCSGLFDALLRFNVPFTFVKELLVCVITFLIYKKLSPVLHGRKTA